MKLVKSWLGVVCAAAFLLSVNAALAESCCVKAKVAGKDCTHKCCTAAHKDGKTCEKCQADATCCDKAIAKSESCKHPCCVESTKAGKVCDKCNAPKEKKKESA